MIHTVYCQMGMQPLWKVTGWNTERIGDVVEGTIGNLVQRREESHTNEWWLVPWCLNMAIPYETGIKHLLTLFCWLDQWCALQNNSHDFDAQDTCGDFRKCASHGPGNHPAPSPDILTHTHHTLIHTQSPPHPPPNDNPAYVRW